MICNTIHTQSAIKAVVQWVFEKNSRFDSRQPHQREPGPKGPGFSILSAGRLQHSGFGALLPPSLFSNIIHYHAEKIKEMQHEILVCNTKCHIVCGGSPASWFSIKL